MSRCVDGSTVTSPLSQISRGQTLVVWEVADSMRHRDGYVAEDGRVCGTKAAHRCGCRILVGGRRDLLSQEWCNSVLLS